MVILRTQCQHCNTLTPQSHAVCTELNCTDGTLCVQISDTYDIILLYTNTDFRTKLVRKDFKQKGRKERGEKFGGALERQRHGEA